MKRRCRSYRWDKEEEEAGQEKEGEEAVARQRGEKEDVEMTRVIFLTLVPLLQAVDHPPPEADQYKGGGYEGYLTRWNKPLPVLQCLTVTNQGNIISFCGI
ncbi:hypothetical protein STEG23_035977 [Scotinomys teguina]